MPDTKACYCAFIWYHAEPSVGNDLKAWVQRMGRELRVEARLMVRELPERTTFMEIYEAIADDEAGAAIVIDRIEDAAARQGFAGRLISPRRAEVFARFGA